MPVSRRHRNHKQPNKHCGIDLCRLIHLGSGSSFVRPCLYHLFAAAAFRHHGSAQVKIRLQTYHYWTGHKKTPHIQRSMDLFFEAISLYRRRKYDVCIDKCNLLLQHEGAGAATAAMLGGGPWELKMRAMTQRVYVDDIEATDGIAGNLFRKRNPSCLVYIRIFGAKLCQ